MPEGETLLLFMAASLAILISPGPAIFYIVARSLEQGRRAGLISTLGIATGTLFHIAAAALGLSAILLASATAFTVLKFSGAAYLIWLGLRTILTGVESGAVTLAPTRRLGQIFRQGVIVNVLNPKTALFFFAFLPQFANPARGPVGLQMAMLGSLFVLVGIVSDGLWALAAASLGGRWKGRALRLLSGSVMIALGLATALTDRIQA